MARHMKRNGNIWINGKLRQMYRGRSGKNYVRRTTYKRVVRRGSYKRGGTPTYHFADYKLRNRLRDKRHEVRRRTPTNRIW